MAATENRRLSRYFDKSAAIVQDAATQFEKLYARPAYQNMRVYFEERPIISTFVTIFTLLSLLPVAFFAGTALFVFTTFTLASLFIAVFASLSIILFCLGFLALVLFGTFLASLFLTGATLASYSIIRLALHIQREGASTGMSEWSRETRDTLMPGGVRLPVAHNLGLAPEEREKTKLEPTAHNGPGKRVKDEDEPDGLYARGRGDGVEVRKKAELDREFERKLADDEDQFSRRLSTLPTQQPPGIDLRQRQPERGLEREGLKMKSKREHEDPESVRDYKTNVRYGDYNVDVQGHQ